MAMRNAARVQGIVIGLAAALAALTAWQAIDRERALGPNEATPMSTRSLAAVELPAASVAAPPRTSHPAAAGAGPFGGPRPIQEMELRAAREASVRLESRWASDMPAAHAPAGLLRQVEVAVASAEVARARSQPRAAAADCRASMCRIAASFPKGSDVSDWATRLALQVGSALPNAATVVLPGRDGGYEVVVYAFRPGMSSRP